MNKKVLYLGLLAPIAVAPLAVVASCADTSNIGNKAFDNIQRSLDYWSRSQTLTFARDVQINSIPTLKSTENFGFITNVFSVSDWNDVDGTIKVKVEIRRGPSENYEKTFTVGGFKTLKQHGDETTANSTVQGSTMFSKPTDAEALKTPGILRMDVKSDKKDSDISEILKQVNETENNDPKQDKKMDKLIELTGIKKEKTTTSNVLSNSFANANQGSNKVTEILNQKLKANQYLRLVDVKPTGDFGISSGIEARVQIVDASDANNEKTSSVYVVLISGFDVKVDKSFLEEFTDNHLSGKILNWKMINPETNLIPFDLNAEKDPLSTFLLNEGGNNNGNNTSSTNGKGSVTIDANKRIHYELLDGGRIKGSEDVAAKSLRAKFKFSIENEADSEIIKEVTLYGFDFK